MGSNATANVVFGIEITHNEEDYPWNKEEDNTDENRWWNDPEEWLRFVKADNEFEIYFIGNAYADISYMVLGLKEKTKFHKCIWEGEIIDIEKILDGMSTITIGQAESLIEFVKKHFPDVDKPNPSWLLGVSYG